MGLVGCLCAPWISEVQKQIGHEMWIPDCRSGWVVVEKLGGFGWWLFCCCIVGVNDVMCMHLSFAGCVWLVFCWGWVQGLEWPTGRDNGCGRKCHIWSLLKLCARFCWLRQGVMLVGDWVVWRVHRWMLAMVGMKLKSMVVLEPLGVLRHWNQKTRTSQGDQCHWDGQWWMGEGWCHESEVLWHEEPQISPEHLPHVPGLGEEDRHWENEVVLRVQRFQ